MQVISRNGKGISRRWKIRLFFENIKNRIHLNLCSLKAFFNPQIIKLTDEDKFMEVLQSYNKDIKCYMCGKQITKEHVSAILTMKNQLLFLCDNPMCQEVEKCSG